jgi:predicted nicotinamide N-methyase
LIADVPVPARAALVRLLAEHAPLVPAPLCPEILVHQARSLVEVWEAAERLAGRTLAAPFWAYAWPGGTALARVLLDHPALVEGRRVVDFGAGGGVASLAAARAGGIATANDVDPWALEVVSVAAAAQQLAVATMRDDVCDAPWLVADFDVVLCSDLAYERREAPRQRRVLERAAAEGLSVLVADAGRTYFDSSGMRLMAEYEVHVPQDLEGVTQRTARVFSFGD